MKFLAAVLALCFAVFCFGQDFSKPVTYSARALPLRAVLDDLSKQGGVKLKATPDMEGEPLILKLNAVPLKSAMDQMADAFAADWIDHKGFWRLERSDEKIAKIREAILEQRTKAIEHSFEELRKKEAKYAPMTSESSDQLVTTLFNNAKKSAAGQDVDDITSMELYSQIPAQRLIRKIVLSMDPRELAEIPIGRRVAFATDPDAVQRKLPEATSKLFEQFDKDNAMFNASLDKVVPADQKGLMTAYTYVSKEPLTRVVVANQPFPGDETLTLEVALNDAKGHKIAMENQMLGTTIEDWSQGQVDYTKLRLGAQKDGFELGPIARELAPHTGPNAASLRPLPKDVIEILLDPIHHDPLSIATSDLLLTAADRDNANLIALPTDNCEYYALNSSRLGKTNLGVFSAIASRQANVSIDEKDGWIVLKPHDPMAAAAERLPREALQNFLVDFVKKGYISIDNGADLMASGSLEMRTDLAEREAAYIKPGSRLDGLGAMPGTLRFFGILSPKQRDDATRGALTFHMSELDKDQRVIATSMIFDAYNQLQQSYAQRSPEDDPNPHLIERTDFLPGGLTNDVEVQVTDESKPVAFAQMTQYGGGTFTGSLPLEALASSIVDTLHPELSYSINPSKLNALKPGAQRTVTITIKQDNKVIQDELHEEHPSDGEMMTIDQYIASLPEDQRRNLEAQVAKMIEMQKARHQNRPNAPAPNPTGGQKPPRSEAA